MTEKTIWNDPTTLAWFAGLYEGEGCIGAVTKRGSEHLVYLQMTVGMTDRDVIERVGIVTGVGHVSGPHRPKSAKPHWKDKWIWRVGKSVDVERVAEAILPMLGARRQLQAGAALTAWREQEGPRPLPSLVDSFWARVLKNEDGHWVWAGMVDQYGFGTLLGRSGERFQAHRFAWELDVGSVQGRRLRNTCGMKHCVRPDHWEIDARLDDEKVREIRRLHAGGVSQAALSRRFEVARATISNICSRKSWGHVA